MQIWDTGAYTAMHNQFDFTSSFFLIAFWVFTFLSLFILAGQEKFRAMTPMYYRNANAALLCFDLTNHKSFLDVKDWVQELHKYEFLVFVFVFVQIRFSYQFFHFDRDRAC